jgi:hypothetical protein
VVKSRADERDRKTDRDGAQKETGDATSLGQKLDFGPDAGDVYASGDAQKRSGMLKSSRIVPMRAGGKDR